MIVQVPEQRGRIDLFEPFAAPPPALEKAALVLGRRSSSFEDIIRSVAAFDDEGMKRDPSATLTDIMTSAAAFAADVSTRRQDKTTLSPDEVKRLARIRITRGRRSKTYKRLRPKR